jgi:hypothetical protein
LVGFFKAGCLGGLLFCDEKEVLCDDDYFHEDPETKRGLTKNSRPNPILPSNIKSRSNKSHPVNLVNPVKKLPPGKPCTLQQN